MYFGITDNDLENVYLNERVLSTVRIDVAKGINNS